MRRIVAITALAAAFTSPAAAAEPRTAPDCRFDGARSYESFGTIRTFTAGSTLYGCLTDVGRAHRLDTGTLRARSSTTRSTLFGAGDWVGFQARGSAGRTRARALNLRTGRTHAARTSAPITALVANHDGTLTWIAGTALRTKTASSGARLLASDGAIDRSFLGLENDRGCAVTWKLGGEQRSSSIFCATP
ncbi:MAG: hypothetical protein ACRDJY_00325 [Thermoleophilaceae bacterium]